MGKKLARNVTLMDPEKGFLRFKKGEEPDSDVAERITNPHAWESDEKAEHDPAYGPITANGLGAMDEEEVFAAANSTSVVSEGDLQTTKATGDYQSSATYESMTIPQLRAAAVERELDVQGLTRKQEFVDLLVEDDADNS